MLLISCAAHAIPWEISSKISRGHTEADVLSIAGGPNARTYAGSCGNGVEYQWLYIGGSGERDVVVTFCSGKVTSVEQKGFTK